MEGYTASIQQVVVDNSRMEAGSRFLEVTVTVAVAVEIPLALVVKGVVGNL